MWRAVAFFGDEVRPVHLPPGKEEEGTALPPDEPDRPFPVGSVGVDESDLLDFRRVNEAEKTKRMRSGTYCEGRSSVALRCA